MIEALALLSGEQALVSELGSISYQERMFRVREAYRALLFYLIDHYIGAMNPSQRLFVNTGAIADCVVFEDGEGGREAAVRAGMGTVGVGDPARLKKADMIKKGFNQLLLL